jgi:hypothetical protein
VNGIVRLVRAAIAAVVLIAGCTGGTPSLSPKAPVATPAATQVVSPATSPPQAAATPRPTMELAMFTSPLYGFTFAHPASWVPRAAKTRWQFGDYVEPDERYVDSVRPPGSPLGALAGIAAQPLPDGMTDEAWFRDWEQRRDAAGVACRFPPETWTNALVAGAAARRIEAPCSIANGAPFDRLILELAWIIDGTAYVATGTPAIVEIMVDTFQPG